MDSNIIGVFLPNIHKTGRHEYIDELSRMARLEGYRVMCFSSYTDLFNKDSFDSGEKSIYSLAKNVKLAGMIVYAELIKDDQVNEMLISYGLELGIPVFTIEKKYDGTFFIEYDYEGAIEDIVSHLVEMHSAKNICFVSGMENNSFSKAREDAYQRALEAHGIEFDQSKIYYGGFWEEPAILAANEIINSSDELPDAIVCANDIMAIAICGFLEQNGINVPSDIIVTGVDGIERAENNYPTITTAKCDYKSSCRYILDIIESYGKGMKIKPHREQFSLNLSLAQSCGCHNATSYHAAGINSKLHNTIRSREMFGLEMDHMTLLYNDGRGLKETLIALERNIKTVLYRGIEIYIDPSYFDSSDENLPSKILAASLTHGVFEYSVPFAPTPQDVICSQNLLEAADTVICVPIHCMDKVYGYAAAGYTCSNTEDGERLYDFITHLDILFSSIENFEKLNKMVATLNDMYIRDPLTNLLNRRGFYREIDNIIVKANECGKSILIISADLDGLKHINDTYGHSEGDFAIVTLANIFSSLITDEIGICARFGGDEYMVAVVSEEDPTDTEKKILKMVKDASKTFNKPYSINASIGIEKVSGDEAIASLADIIKRADNKMLKRKKGSKFSRKQ